MKRNLMLVLMFMFIISSVPLLAMDVSVGAATWYSWWEMSMKTDGVEEDSDVDPTILYGPVLSVSFSDKLTLSSIFLYGQFDMHHDGGEDETIKRFDSDTSINYNLNNYIKLFCGVKIMGYKFNGGTNQSIGPAAGIGITLPVVGNLYLLGNISGMYNYGHEESKNHDNGEPQEVIFNAPGINSTLAIAYYIDKASTTVSLGGRYQYFKINYESGATTESDLSFYGVTLSLIYSF